MSFDSALSAIDIPRSGGFIALARLLLGDTRLPDAYMNTTTI